MCGIVGYIGKENNPLIGLEALRRLEYRGYDSSGAAVYNPSKKKVVLIRAVGKVKNLEEKLPRALSGSPFIFHTRWATHGIPSEKNAHPHKDCQNNIFLVHNGIVENYQALKNKLIKKGHHFSSDTDTEVLSHLIEGFFKGNLEEAVINALKLIKGTYGLAIIARDDPQKIVLARQGSPLLIGIGDNEYLAASDPAAIISRTKKVVYLKDGEVAVLTPKNYLIFDLDYNHKNEAPRPYGRGIFSRALSGAKSRRSGKFTSHSSVSLRSRFSAKEDKEIKTIDWNLEEAQKGGYPHFMFKEIMEQPESLGDSQRGRLLIKEGMAKLGGLETVKERLKGISNLKIVACGTAYHAGLVGQYLLEEYAGLATTVETASEFRYRRQVLEKDTAIMAISQSGETFDTLSAIKEAKEKGILTLGIVNVVGSSIAKETGAGVYNHAGPEIGVASTKAFTSQLEVLSLLALFLARQRGMSLTEGRHFAEAIKNLSILAKRVLKNSRKIKALAKKYQRAKGFLILGRKYNYPIALEGALKIKEISYINTQGYPAGEMKHGPIALIDKDFPTIVICLKDSVYEKMVSSVREIKARSGPVIVLATEGDRKITKIADEVIYIPKIIEPLSPILSVIPLQLIAYYLGVFNGYDVDKPRNLAKSVTVE